MAGDIVMADEEMLDFELEANDEYTDMDIFLDWH